MKNTPDAYERYLSTYLSNNNYPEAEDLSFITARADQAYDCLLYTSPSPRDP